MTEAGQPRHLRQYRHVDGRRVQRHRPQQLEQQQQVDADGLDHVEHKPWRKASSVI